VGLGDGVGSVVSRCTFAGIHSNGIKPHKTFSLMS
jgi:hypothetical protein